VALAVERDGGEAAAWRTSFERSLAVEDRMTFVAVMDGRVAGHGTAGWFAPSALAPDSTAPDGWYLLGLVVDPVSRRHGIGRELTRARLAWLRTRTHRVWYFASSANLASIDLHAELGFDLAANNIEVPGVAFTASGQLYSADVSCTH
jgi:GNAT superfamily N-acetyltransferase